MEAATKLMEAAAAILDGIKVDLHTTEAILKATAITEANVEAIMVVTLAAMEDTDSHSW